MIPSLKTLVVSEDKSGCQTIPSSSDEGSIDMVGLFHYLLRLSPFPLRGGSVVVVLPAFLDLLGGLYPDTGVPLSRGKNCDLIQELVYPSQQVVSSSCMICYIMEYLIKVYIYGVNMLTKFTKQFYNDTVVVGTDKKNDHYNNKILPHLT